MSVVNSFINSLFDLLIKETKSFMQLTYDHPCNKDFRDYPSKTKKAEALTNLYILSPVAIDFNKKGVKICNGNNISEHDDVTLLSSCQVYYSITMGEETFQKLLCMYYLQNKNNYPLFRLFNSFLLIECGIVNVNKDLDDIDALLLKTINGGEESIRKAIDSINERILEFNKEISTYAFLICK